MPEELPTPDKNIKELEKEIKKVSKMQNKSNYENNIFKD